MGRIRLAFAWLRRWGMWIVSGALFMGVAVLVILLRITNQRKTAHAMMDRIEDLDRQAAASYERARAEYLAREIDEAEQRVVDARGEMDAIDSRSKDDETKINDMSDEELAVQLNRRFPGSGPDGE